uniref:Conjugal transfer protein n=1 Tax=Rhabditophanes sp. KR3021 TaxID=114890 RepID=A0AC35TUU4_9BILA
MQHQEVEAISRSACNKCIICKTNAITDKSESYKKLKTLELMFKNINDRYFYEHPPLHIFTRAWIYILFLPVGTIFFLFPYLLLISIAVSGFLILPLFCFGHKFLIDRGIMARKERTYIEHQNLFCTQSLKKLLPSIAWEYIMQFTGFSKVRRIYGWIKYSGLLGPDIEPVRKQSNSQ